MSFRFLGYNGQSSSQVIIGVVRPVPDDDPGMPRDPAADLPMNQYVSRHDLSGQILDADSRYLFNVLELCA